MPMCSDRSGRHPSFPPHGGERSGELTSPLGRSTPIAPRRRIDATFAGAGPIIQMCDRVRRPRLPSIMRGWTTNGTNRRHENARNEPNCPGDIHALWASRRAERTPPSRRRSLTRREHPSIEEPGASDRRSGNDGQRFGTIAVQGHVRPGTRSGWYGRASSVGLGQGGRSGGGSSARGRFRRLHERRFRCGHGRR